MLDLLEIYQMGKLKYKHNLKRSFHHQVLDMVSLAINLYNSSLDKLLIQDNHLLLRKEIIQTIEVAVIIIELKPIGMLLISLYHINLNNRQVYQHKVALVYMIDCMEETKGHLNK